MIDYAQLTLPHHSLGSLSPFEVVHRYLPRTTFDWKSSATGATPTDKLNLADAQRLASRFQNAWTFAQSQTVKAQETMRRNVDSHCRPVDFAVGNNVWLDMRYYPSTRPSKKLDFPINGPLTITVQLGNSFR